MSTSTSREQVKEADAAVERRIKSYAIERAADAFLEAHGFDRDGRPIDPSRPPRRDVLKHLDYVSRR